MPAPPAQNALRSGRNQSSERVALRTRRVASSRLGSPFPKRLVIPVRETPPRRNRGRRRHPLRQGPLLLRLQRPRELLHDAKVYQAYEREAERLREDGAVIHRLMLDTELKREYQQFLQEHNRGKSDSDGRPDRSPDEESRVGRWTTTFPRRRLTSSSPTRASCGFAFTASTGKKGGRGLEPRLAEELLR